MNHPLERPVRHPIERLNAEKNTAYTERNRLVAALARLYPASLELNPNLTEAANGWLWICFVDLPTGQASWHIPDEDAPLFEGLPRLRGRVWDQHTTTEKYERVALLRVEDHVHAAFDLLTVIARSPEACDLGPGHAALVRQAQALLDARNAARP